MPCLQVVDDLSLHAHEVPRCAGNGAPAHVEMPACTAVQTSPPGRWPKQQSRLHCTAPARSPQQRLPGKQVLQLSGHILAAHSKASMQLQHAAWKRLGLSSVTAQREAQTRGPAKHARRGRAGLKPRHAGREASCAPPGPVFEQHGHDGVAVHEAACGEGQQHVGRLGGALRPYQEQREPALACAVLVTGREAALACSGLITGQACRSVLRTMTSSNQDQQRAAGACSDIFWSLSRRAA